MSKNAFFLRPCTVLKDIAVHIIEVFESRRFTKIMSENAEEILGTYKRMMAECQQIATKISEVM